MNWAGMWWADMRWAREKRGRRKGPRATTEQVNGIVMEDSNAEGR